MTESAAGTRSRRLDQISLTSTGSDDNQIPLASSRYVGNPSPLAFGGLMVPFCGVKFSLLFIALNNARVLRTDDWAIVCHRHRFLVSSSSFVCRIRMPTIKACPYQKLRVPCKHCSYVVGPLSCGDHDSSDLFPSLHRAFLFQRPT